MSSIPARSTLHRFGEKLRLIRLEYNLTLQQFAKSVGYNAHGYISELETGKKTPTIDFVLSVATQYRVSLDDLLQDELDLQFTPFYPRKPTNLMSSLPLIDREMTDSEFERFRLLLSTFQDGSGMLMTADGTTLPGWRDFERTIANLFDGKNQENKAIFDVVVADSIKPVQYGISCKMRSELDRVQRDGKATIELSNSSKKFNDYLKAKELLPADYRNRAHDVGIGLIESVERWKELVGLTNGGMIDLEKSGYLVLLYNRTRNYQLFWFGCRLPNPRALYWYYPEIKTKSGESKPGGHLNGDLDSGSRIFEWYGDSGGQLKYYPAAETALWKSPQFKLEPLSEQAKLFGLSKKAESYFPAQWAQTNLHSPNE